MRINLTKKDLVNVVYMQIGFQNKYPKANWRIFSLITENLIKEEKIKISKFGTFFIKIEKIKNR